MNEILFSLIIGIYTIFVLIRLYTERIGMYTLTYFCKGIKYQADTDTEQEALELALFIFNDNGTPEQIMQGDKIIYHSSDIYKLLGKRYY